MKSEVNPFSEKNIRGNGIYSFLKFKEEITLEIKITIVMNDLSDAKLQFKSLN
jgi:hypothetical protein